MAEFFGPVPRSVSKVGMCVAFMDGGSDPVGPELNLVLLRQVEWGGVPGSPRQPKVFLDLL